MKFIKINLFILSFLLFSVNSLVKAQNETHTAFSTQMNTIFSTLEKNRVPHGLLQDFAFDFAELSNYNGVLTDTNMVSRDILRDIYSTIVMSAIHNNAGILKSPDEIDSLWQIQRQPGIITLGGVYYNYSRFRDNALTANLLTLTSNKFYDKYVSGVWQNPYQTEAVFAMSPPRNEYRGSSFKVVMPANLWLTNNSSGISNIAVNFGDGSGYRTITPGTEMNVIYPDTGQKTWTFRLKLTNNTYLYSHTVMHITQMTPGESLPAGRYLRPGGPLFVMADDAYLSQYAQGWITVDYASSDRVMRKPLIVAEGFDSGYLLNPEEQYGDTDYKTFTWQVERSFSNFKTLLQGSTQQYDIIYIDWKRGADYLQRNAYLLQKVIKWVNAEKAKDGITEPNVVLGQSMGGVIARWALRDMEDRSMNHQTRLYISWDSPHQGANIPISYQHAARHARDLYMKTPTPYTLGIFSAFRIFKNTLYLIDEPAARQMIKNRLNKDAVLDNADHITWQNALKAKGYPQLTRNVAVSNGSECALGQGFEPGETIFNFQGKATGGVIAELLSSLTSILSVFTLKPQFLLGVLPGKSSMTFDFHCRAQPQSSSSQIYKGKITYSKKILWLVNVNTTVTDRAKNAVPSVLPMDGLPGGAYFPDIDIKTDLKDWIDIVFVKYNATLDFQPQFNFIPTASALDIGGGNVTLTLADYKAKYKGSNPPIAPKNSPFINFITAGPWDYNNEPHIDINTRNGDWVASELSGGSPVSEEMCCPTEYTISGSDFVCTNRTYNVSGIPSTAIVTWYAYPLGMVSLTTSGNSCTATRIGSSTGSVILYAMVEDCGFTYLKKPLHLGLPTYQLTGHAIIGLSPLDGEGTVNLQCYSNLAVGNKSWTTAALQGHSSVTWSKVSSIPATGTSILWSGGVDGSGMNSVNVHFRVPTASINLKTTISNSCGSIEQYYNFASNGTQCTVAAMRGGEEIVLQEVDYYDAYMSHQTLVIAYKDEEETKSELAKIIISDKMGNIILEKTDASIRENTIQIDMSPYKSDNYYVVLQYVDGNIEPQQVAKF